MAKVCHAHSLAAEVQSGCNIIQFFEHISREIHTDLLCGIFHLAVVRVGSEIHCHRKKKLLRADGFRITPSYKETIGAKPNKVFQTQDQYSS